MVYASSLSARRKDGYCAESQIMLDNMHISYSEAGQHQVQASLSEAPST